VSTAGTWLGFGAFPLIAIRVLHSGPTAISALSGVSLAAGALLAMPLGPWVEARRKRTVMIAADVLRFGALVSVPLGYAAGRSTYLQLVVVSVIGTAANIAFTSASEAYLPQIVAPAQLVRAYARFESTAWTAIAIGPTLGGVAIGLFGPVVTVALHAGGFLLSALGVTAVRVPEKVSRREAHASQRTLVQTDLFAVNALVLAAEPLLAVLLLRDLHWPAWEYGLAFGLPCVGGFAGSRFAARVTDRHRTLRIVGVLRVLWPVGLAFVGPGAGGLILVMVVEFGVITCFGVFNPLMATERIERMTAEGLVLWNALNSAVIAATTILWGVLAALTTTRIAIGAAGVLLLLTPFRARRRPAGPGCRTGER
jgi:MFS family permease